MKSTTLLTGVTTLCVCPLIYERVPCAGVFCILGLAVYPLSWSSDRVALMCGPLAGDYSLGGCQTGNY